MSDIAAARALTAGEQDTETSWEKAVSLSADAIRRSGADLCTTLASKACRKQACNGSASHDSPLNTERHRKDFDNASLG
jgi:hypothetical protein